MYQEMLKQFRKRSIEKTLKAGLPAYFIDESLGEGVIRIKPDGAMDRITVQQGRQQIKPFECRAC
jgi:hypothetical protein